jgi:hypothetical protein
MWARSFGKSLLKIFLVENFHVEQGGQHMRENICFGVKHANWNGVVIPFIHFKCCTYLRCIGFFLNLEIYKYKKHLKLWARFE